MARGRYVKPEFFGHEGLFDLEQSSGLPLRVAFAGIWTVCDREGRFAWRPRTLKREVLPYDDLDFSAVLDALAQGGFVASYEVGGEKYGRVVNWHKHQKPHVREPGSRIPAPGDERPHLPLPSDWGNDRATIPDHVRQAVFARDGGVCLRCRSDSGLTLDHIFPHSIGGDDSTKNLRTLCGSCNSARPVAGQALIDDLAKDGLTLDDLPRNCLGTALNVRRPTSIYSDSDSDSDSNSDSVPRPRKIRSNDYTPGFLVAWSAYTAQPHKVGRSAKIAAFVEWDKLALEPLAEKVLAWIVVMRASDDWTKDGGQFVPGMQVWLKGRDFSEPPPVPERSPVDGLSEKGRRTAAAMRRVLADREGRANG